MGKRGLNDCGHLYELIRGKELVEAPRKTTRPPAEWYEFLVGIGDDNTAHIYMTKDDLEVLNNIDKS